MTSDEDERKQRFRNAHDDLLLMGSRVMHTLGNYRGDGLIGVLQRSHGGGFVTWIKKGLTPEQESAIFGMAQSALLADGTVPTYDLWQPGRSEREWVFPITDGIIASWLSARSDVVDEPSTDSPHD